MNHKVGTKLRCVDSKSNAYTKGGVYVVESHPFGGQRCLRGDDGIYDDLKNLISKFEKVDDGPKQNLTVVPK